MGRNETGGCLSFSITAAGPWRRPLYVAADGGAVIGL